MGVINLADRDEEDPMKFPRLPELYPNVTPPKRVQNGHPYPCPQYPRGRIYRINTELNRTPNLIEALAKTWRGGLSDHLK